MWRVRPRTPRNRAGISFDLRVQGQRYTSIIFCFSVISFFLFLEEENETEIREARSTYNIRVCRTTGNLCTRSFTFFEIQ